MTSVAEDEKAYTVLIGDIVHSRRLEDRATVQDILSAAMDTVNDRHQEAIAADLRFVAGDEVQGLLSDAGAAVPIMSYLADRLEPARMIHGLGRGALTTPTARDVAAMDGPCFHRARRAIAGAKSDDVWAVVKGYGPATDIHLTTLFALVGELRSNWTSIQARYARSMRYARTQGDVAEMYGVSDATVSKTLKRAGYRTVRWAEQVLEEDLRHGSLIVPKVDRWLGGDDSGD